MAISKVETSRIIHLTLNEKEAQYIHARFQNQMVENEGEPEYKLRQGIWEALNEAAPERKR